MSLPTVREIEVLDVSPGAVIPMVGDPRYVRIRWVEPTMGDLLGVIDWDWPRRVYDWQADGL